MNADEVANAQAIANELGIEISVRDNATDGDFELLVLDTIDGPQFIQSHADFVEMYGTLESVRAGFAELDAEIAMDEATAADLTARMLEVCASFQGHEVAPRSALPDTLNRVRHALQVAYEAESDPERERAMMTALVDLEAFIPDGLIPPVGDRVSADIRGVIKDDQTVAVVAVSGVNGWRADAGLPARIGDAERAIRIAVASQAGYNASGAPAMIVGFIATAVVGVVAVLAAVASTMSLLAAVAAVAVALAGAIGGLGVAGRLASANAAAAWLDRATPGGKRAGRVMALVEWLPVAGSVVGGAIGFAVAAVILR